MNQLVRAGLLGMYVMYVIFRHNEIKAQDNHPTQRKNRSNYNIYKYTEINRQKAKKDKGVNERKFS